MAQECGLDLLKEMTVELGDHIPISRKRSGKSLSPEVRVHE
jgi:hypothetical protein